MHDNTIERPQLAEFDMVEQTLDHYRPSLDDTTVECIDVGLGGDHPSIRRKKIYKLKVIIDTIPERLQSGGAIGYPTFVKSNDVGGVLEVVSQKVEQGYDDGTEMWTLEER